MEGTDSGVHFLNVSYFFRILYETLFGGGGVELGISGLLVFLSHLWLFITVLAILISIAAIWVMIYSTMRIYQIRVEEAPLYGTVSKYEEHERVEHSRWKYIQELMATPSDANWRQAIIEADIILDELLTRLGYVGDTVSDKLKAVNPARFATLNNAWDAHRVRNQIAHEGSNFDLSERIAYRTIAHYEVVFREHEEI
jgi:hypothetical protein